ncbi:MAG TPA: rhodanese-like domain-containing protein [Candidatus Obscuribacterales bacterium]
MDAFFSLLPRPPALRSKSRVYDLKARLDWGEPALTIIDVRDRSQFNLSHITGAISMPLHELPARTLDCLEFDRDLYVYGDIDEEAAEAAAKLRIAGYRQVSELRGGLPAWKAVGYPIEATLTTSQT